MNWIYRRYGLRWPSDYPPADLLMGGVSITLMLLAVLTLYGWVGAMDAAAAAEDRLAHCLNGGTFQVNTNDALKCQGVLYEKGN